MAHRVRWVRCPAPAGGGRLQPGPGFRPWSSGGGRVARWVRCPAPAGMGVRSQAGPWCQAGTPRHPLHGGGGRRKDAGPAGRCAPPERLDDAGEPGQLAFFYPLFGVSVQYLKVCSGVEGFSLVNSGV